MATPAPIVSRFKVLKGGWLRYSGRRLNDADKWAGHTRRVQGELWVRLAERAAK